MEAGYRYRGVKNPRTLVFMNVDDMTQRGLKKFDLVDITSFAKDSTTRKVCGYLFDQPVVTAEVFNNSFATVMTASGSNPNFLWSSLSGAEAPNVCIPIMRPLAPM